MSWADGQFACSYFTTSLDTKFSDIRVEHKLLARYQRNVQEAPAALSSYSAETSLLV